MSFTRKDYQLIADSFQQQLSEVHGRGSEDIAIYTTLEHCANRLANKFEATQSNFDKARFLQAAIGRTPL